jgi:hypothetical protein
MMVPISAEVATIFVLTIFARLLVPSTFSEDPVMAAPVRATAVTFVLTIFARLEIPVTFAEPDLIVAESTFVHSKFNTFDVPARFMVVPESCPIFAVVTFARPTRSDVPRMLDPIMFVLTILARLAVPVTFAATSVALFNTVRFVTVACPNVAVPPAIVADCVVMEGDDRIVTFDATRLLKIAVPEAMLASAIFAVDMAETGGKVNAPDMEKF